MHLQYNTEAEKSQGGEPEVLRDISPSGRERPWHVRKLENQYISAAYEEVNVAKAGRLSECAKALLFVRKEGGGLRLKQANFCRVRLCPICAWRRSLKTSAHFNRILRAAEPEHLEYIMATFTLRNCQPDELSRTLDTLIGGYKNLVKRKRYRQAWVGWYRGVEITHNLQDGTYHPHIHALIGVKRSYFKSNKYIRQEDLTQDWREVCHLDYNPIVDIRKIKRYKGKDGTSRLDIIKAVNEAAKYTVKASDIICFDDWDLTVETVRLLDSVMDKRRFIAYGGLFKELHHKLNLDDEEEGDLLNVGDQDEDEEKETADEVLFWWHTGYGRYVK